MNETVDAGMILRFGLKCLGIFGLIFLLALLTPWMAKQVDALIAKYKASHQEDPEKSDHPENMPSVRSVYELPPAPKPAARKKVVVRKKTNQK